MSNIKINQNTYREEDIALNMGVEFVKSLINSHSGKGVLDHADGSVTLEKLAADVTDLIDSAIKGVNDNNTEIANAKNDIARVEGDCKNERLVYKVYQLKAGETFLIKPEMFFIALPYGGKTIGIYKSNDSQLISGNVGFTIGFSPEINTGEYANGHNHRVVFFYQPQSVLTTIASHHDLLETGSYLKNNGEGNMYVFALMREVDAK